MRTITLNPKIGSPFTSVELTNAELAQLMKEAGENRIIIKTESGTFKDLSAPKDQFEKTYRDPKHLVTLFAVNSVLAANNEPLLTDEEAEVVLYPFGREQDAKPEEIQALAGFKVEKTVILTT